MRIFGIIILMAGIIGGKVQSQNHPAPTADFLYEGVCLGDTTFFTNDSYFAFEYFWLFGDSITGIVDTSTEIHPFVVFDSVGVYNVTLYASNGHKSSITKSIRIDTIPQAAFITVGHCLGTSTFLESNASCEDSINWRIENFKDSLLFVSNEKETYYSFPDSGWFNVKLIAFNTSGTDTISDSIYIHGSPIADFEFSNNCESPTTSFTNLSSCATSFNWSFGDSWVPDSNYSVEQNPYHRYDSIGSYWVTLVVQNKYGVDSISKEIEILDIPPIVSFDYLVTGDTVQFINKSKNTIGYTWEFGDGDWSSDKDPIHVYQEEGEYEVVLNTYSICFANRDTQLVIFKKVGVLDADPLHAVSIYPNPAHSTLQFNNLEYNGRPIQINIYNSIGRLVRSDKIMNNVITVSGLKPGLYYLDILNTDSSRKFTFIKY